jgi:hypothetical protein
MDGENTPIPSSHLDTKRKGMRRNRRENTKSENGSLFSTNHPIFSYNLLLISGD